MRRLVVLLVLAAMLPAAQAAASAAKRMFQVAGGDATVTLRQFAEQSGEQVIYVVPKVRGVKTHPVRGEFTAREVLERMLANTELVIVQDPQTGALLVQRTSPRDRAPAPAAPEAGGKSRPTTTSPMPTKNLLSRVAAAIAALALPLADAAEAATPTDPASTAPVQLSPFEVRTDQDVGYVATSSLAGSRMNTDLRDTPVAISVFTRDFLDDIGKVDVNQAIEYGLNTISEVGFTGNDFNENNFNFRIRGIGSAQRARNYFKTQLNLDVYNTERIDFARGPNAILFGEASPSGIVNTSTKFARLNQNRTAVQLRVASYDDRRVALDVNRTLGRNLAVRFNALWQDAEGYREFEFKKKEGFALAATWRPFEPTQLRVEAESIDINENRSRPWTAYDAFSVWETAGAPGSGTATQWGTPVTGTTRLLGGNGFIVADSGLLGGVPLFMNAGAPITVNDPNQFRVSTGPTNIPGLNQSPQVMDFSRHPRDGNLSGAGARSDSAAKVGGIYLEQQIGENLTIELAAGAEYEKRLWANPIGFAGITVRYDTNAFLPTFNSAGQQTGIAANPNFRRQFTFGNMTERYFKQYRVQERATATYNLDLDKILTRTPRLGKILGRHRFAGLFSNEDFYDDRRNTREVNVSPNRLDANYFAGLNSIQRLSYVDMFSANRAERGHRDPRQQPLSNVPMANRVGLNGAGTATVTSGFPTDTWTWNKNVLGTRMFAMQNYLLNGRLVGLFGWRHDDLESFRSTLVRDAATNEGTGFVRDTAPSVDVSGRTFTRGLVFHATKWLSLYVNEADNFQVQGASQVYGHVERTSGAVDSRAAIGNKKGEGRDAGLKFTLFGGKLYASLGWYEVADANRFTNVDGNFVNTNGLVEAIWTTINNDTPLYDVVGSDTQATVSKGYELELVANPTKQLRLALNLKNSDTQVSDLFPNITRYIAEHRDTWLAPQNANRIVGAGFGSSSGLTVAQVVANTDLLLRTVKAPEGRSPVMDRRVTGNFFGKYSFTSGPLKNFAIGAGANYRDKAVLAYRIQTDQQAAYTPAYTDFNALVQYSGRFWSDKIRYTLQLNVDNLTDNQDPQAVNGGQAVPGNAAQSILPNVDGVVPFYILPEPRRFSLSATFTF